MIMIIPDGLRSPRPEELGPCVDRQSRMSLSLTVAGDVDYGPAITALSTNSFTIIFIFYYN